MSAANDRRAIAGSALVLALIGVVILVMTSGSSYTLNAHFVEAGGLVSGGQVEIAGRPVGSISGITLTPNGQANVELAIDPAYAPLHVGTRASIRAHGQATITNNFVDLSPGPTSAPPLPDGAVLSTEQTAGLVEVDALLDSFGPQQRAILDHLIANSAKVYAGSGAPSFNRMLAELDPALAELEGYTGDLALDRTAISELVRTGSQAATAVASQSPALTSAMTNTARTMVAIASQRAALSYALVQLPGFLAQARGTLASTGDALTALRPTLRDIVPAAGPLHDYLQRQNAVLPQASGVVAQLKSQLPALNRSLVGLQPLADPMVRALATLGTAMKALRPMATGMRYYATDLILGALSGLLGIATDEYQANGHYAKGNFVQSLQTLPSGPLSALLASHPLAPGVLAMRTGLTRRCPGGNQPPAPDGSNPWDLGPAWCTASQDESASVNTP